MKVIVDDKIPYIEEAIRHIADEVVFAPGNKFTPELVKDADALIVRTRTLCNRELLEGSRVQFIATATIGYDHIDTEYCRAAGIVWVNAPGCNADSVAQYVESSLLLLQQERSFCLEGARIGIVGVGNVGSRIAKMAQEHGMIVLKNDPPLQTAHPDEQYSTLEEIARTCDVITFHTPLNRTGIYKSFHLADEGFFAQLVRKPVLINTSRGEVVNTQALLNAMRKGVVSEAIIDVWEEEPHINKELLQKAFLATPHIAGYSADGKANATRMSLQALCKHFGRSFHYEINPPVPAESTIEATSWSEALLKIYNPAIDSNNLKEAPELFEKFRGDYPLRREKSAYTFKKNR
ncbi:4-phosphoerythronate dehydrogenase PdxB [Bacteroides sp. 214]|uniref:4-phosphoerythronate dehydrogenase PdxB n=1 Tax=Bacteroides sp. 214 TaxID=2302935 RepID=UPI0013D4AD6E|nr:4-phosphoerythronate dehydrogenase PdxB [Bacteroides sp. 214]NDW12073.1 4-phosphoerythronate dehydrogenase PdxB [Bacteroides sp. 214]